MSDDLVKNLLSFFGLCYCSGPDHTGKCACQRNNSLEWLNEIEVFSLRRERLYEDFPEVKDKEKLLKWLEAAYNVGFEDGRNH